MKMLAQLRELLTFRIRRVVSFLLFKRRGVINSVFGSYVSPREYEIANSLELYANLKPIMNKLETSKTNSKLMRIGSKNDGGYVLVDKDYSGDFLISGGIFNDNNFEINFANLGGFGHQIDFSVPSPPISHKNLTFSERRLVGEGQQELSYDVSLDEIYTEFVQGSNFENNSTILKLDIEGSEWEIFETAKCLPRFDQILVELHYLNRLADKTIQQESINALNRLLDLFFPVFISGNNCCGVVTMGGFTIPRVLEMTLLNREKYSEITNVTSDINEIFKSQNYPNKAPINLKNW